MKVLVTGGAGYIGSVVVDSLIDLNYEVLVFDSLQMGHREAVNKEAELVVANLDDKAAIDKAIESFKPHSIMHFASHTLVGESMKDPFPYLAENVANANNLLEAAVKHEVKSFVLSSTANLFDDPEKIPIGPSERIVPGSPYGESKFFIERILHWLNQTKGLRYAALRYFNAAGCTPLRGEDHDPELHLIPLTLQVALGQRDNIKIFGQDYDTPDGTCIRDYIHVEDLAQAHILALEALEHQEVLAFNLGNGNGFSVKEVIETTRKVTGHPIPSEVTPRRAGDPAILIADSSLIQETLGWTPKFTDLEEIIQSAWDWFSKNPEGY